MSQSARNHKITTPLCHRNRTVVAGLVVDAWLSPVEQGQKIDCDESGRSGDFAPETGVACCDQPFEAT